ncbi:MAG: alcohol dehydrogenase [Myxococcales bacterium 68-20]|nr:zinc-binding dehydrogenase [Myxococcales bacterium]OJY15173.1 MAG: alcohol dehydrogenase [Myxococcales bacterium 68-20]
MQTEAMVMMATGGPEVLERKTIELREPGPREVRIRVRAVALNHIDIWGRRGLPHFKYEFPHRLGADIAGEIEALGPGATGAKIGDKVVVNPGLSCGACERCLLGEDTFCRSYRILGENTQGGYSRHVVVPDANLLPMPTNLSFEEASAIPLCFLTAWQMVVRKGEVRPGQTVLVQAAGSGVSSAAIQIAKMHGARVIATTGTEEKAKRARELGADEVIVYSTQDFVAETKRLTNKKGADVIIEHVGGEVLAKSILAAAWGGRIVTCGATTGFTPQIDLRHVFFRQVAIVGSTMGPKGDLFGILRHVEDGRLRPVVDRVMPLWSAVEAHRLLEERKVFGKIVLAVD